MLEPWRSHYLHALGVDVYLPRVILPGARPSVVCDWDWAAEESARQSSPDISIEEAIPATSAAPAKIPETAVKPANRPPVPVIEQRAARREPVVEVAARARDGSGIPQFALSVISTDTGALIVDDAPRNSAARGEYLRLISNLLFALQGGPAQGAAAPTLDVFIWPMVKNNPQIDQSADAAREAVAAYVQKQIHNRGLRTVLLLGDNAQQWLPEAARAHLGAACAVSSVSGWRCLGEPALKRQLWLELRHPAVSGR